MALGELTFPQQEFHRDLHTTASILGYRLSRSATGAFGVRLGRPSRSRQCDHRKLVAELTAIGQDPEANERLKTLGVEPSRRAGEAFAAYMRNERERLAPIVEKAGIKPM